MAKNKKKKSAAGNAAQYNKQKMDNYLLAKTIDAERFKAFRAGESTGMLNGIAIMLYLLHERNGFGQVRMARLLEDAIQFCEIYMSPTDEKNENGYDKYGKHGVVTIEDVYEALNDMGVEIDFETGIFRFRDIEVVREEENAK